MSSQGELAAITLRGIGTGDGGLELEPVVSHGFSYAQWLSLPYVHIPMFWSRNPERWVQAGSIPSRCALSPLPAKHFQPRGEQRWNKRGQNGHQLQAGVHGETVLAHQFEIQTAADLPPP